MRQALRAGKLRHPIAVQKRDTPETRNTRGERTTRWETHAVSRASLKPLKGREKYSARRVDARTFNKFETRFVDGLTDEMRLVYRQRSYYVQSVLDIDRRRRRMLVYAVLADPGEELTGINISNALASSDGAFYAVISFDTDQEGSTKVRWKEEGGSWNYTTETDTFPRVFSHSATLGPLDGGKLYSGDVWTEDYFGQTDGYEGGLSWGITDAGVFYVPPQITSGPGATPDETTCVIAWTTDVACYHRVRYQEQGAGSWTTTAWTVSPGTNASIELTGLTPEATVHDYQVESCLVGDGSQSTGWTPELPLQFTTLCSTNIVLSNMSFIDAGMLGALWNFDSNTPVKTKHKWKLTTNPIWNPDSSWESSYVTTHTNVASSPPMVLRIGNVYEVKFKARNKCLYETGWDYHYVIFYFIDQWVMWDY